MKISRWNVILVAALFTGCGDRNVVLKVDLASHLNASDKHYVLPSVPVTPGGLVVGEQPLVADQHVNMLGGMGDAIVVRDVRLTLTTIANATSGSGTATVRVYASDEATNPATTSPVVTQDLSFTAGVPDTVSSSFLDNARMTSLFAQKALRLRITASLHGPSTGVDPLQGDLTIHRLDAVVVAGRKRL